MMSLYGLITIVDRGKSGAVQRIYQTHQVHRSLVLRGHGTANSEIMDMLGLDEPPVEKACWQRCLAMDGGKARRLGAAFDGTAEGFARCLAARNK